MIRRLPLVAVLAAAWTAAAWFLWQSKVPSSLRLPHVDPHRFFTNAQLHAAASFSSVSDLLWALGLATQIVVLVLYAWRGHRFARESAAGPMGTGMLLGMLGFALVWLAQVPFTVLDLWWQRRHGLSDVGYVTSVLGGWLALSGEFVFLCVALAVVMGFARLVGERWWIPAAPIFVGLVLLFAFVSPWLDSTHKLQDPQLRAAAARFERIEGVPHTPIVVAPVRDVTTVPNAEAEGIGPSRRVVLWDTLVYGPFTERELDVVLAHELGHLARQHIWKEIGWYALFAFPGAWIIARVTRRRGGMANPAAVPLALLLLVVLGLLAIPLENAISRHMEAEADWMALRTTRDPAAAIGLFRSFVPATLDQPSPSTVDYLMLENHPTIVQRIAMAEAWRAYVRRLRTAGHAAAQSP